MAILKGIGFALGLIALCAWYYFDNVHPFQPESLFEKLKSQFSNVKSGRISYHYFKQCMSEECTRYMIKDTKEMVNFKRMMAGMLEYDDFIVSAFSDPHLTLDKLYDKMETYSPYAGRPGTEDENEDTIQDAGFADGEEGIPGLFPGTITPIPERDEEGTPINTPNESNLHDVSDGSNAIRTLNRRMMQK